MATTEQYESGAKNLTKRIQDTTDLTTKARIMTYMGNLRYAQYQNTKDPRARRLAGNCYIAARHLGYRAAIAQI